MNFSRKASITVTGTVSPAEIVAAARTQPGFEAAVLDSVQRGAEAGGSASGLTLVSRNAAFGDDGSATVDLVYEKADEPAVADAAPVVPQSDAPVVFPTSAV